MSDSIHDILNSNRSSSDEKLREVTPFITNHDAELGPVEKQIANLQGQLRALQDQRDALRSKLKPYGAVVAPIRRLPEDIVREIFVACLSTERNPTMARTEAPVLLTQICSSLRKIALSTPALWSAIHIPILGQISDEQMDEANAIMMQRAEAVKEWLLRRSGTSPLHISVHVDGRLPNSRVMKKFVDILLACQSRWKSLYLACVPELVSRIAKVHPSKAPLLQSITVRTYGSHDAPKDPWSQSRLLKTPNLTAFSIFSWEDMQQIDVMPSYSVHWENLTHVRLLEPSPLYEGADSTQLADILRQTKRLISCSLETYEYIAASYAEIYLPFLKMLIITEDATRGRGHDAPGILSSINAPQLEVVEYCKISRLNHTPHNLVTLLSKAPNVCELFMRVGVAQDAYLVDVLRQTPLLTALHIQSLAHDDERPSVQNDVFLSHFVQDDADKCLCPKLEYLTCNNYVTLSQESLRNIAVRKSAGRAGGLARWKALSMNVRYSPWHGPEVDGNKETAKLREECGEDVKLNLCFYKCRRGLSRPLDQGFRSQAEDSWCPVSRIPVPIIDGN